MSKKPKTNKKLTAPLLALLLVVGAFYFLQIKKDSAGESPQVSPEPRAEYFTSSELGIRFKLPKDITNEEISSSYEEITSFVGAQYRNGASIKAKRLNITTKKIAQAAAACGTGNGVKPGTLVVIDKYGGSHHEIHGGEAPDRHKHYSYVYEFKEFHLLIYNTVERFDQCGATRLLIDEAKNVEAILEQAIKTIETTS